MLKISYILKSKCYHLQFFYQNWFKNKKNKHQNKKKGPILSLWDNYIYFGLLNIILTKFNQTKAKKMSDINQIGKKGPRQNYLQAAIKE